MWRLRTAEGSGGLTVTLNDYVGRQFWEYDAGAGTQEEREEVERLREDYASNKSKTKHSSDELMRLQFSGKPRKNIAVDAEDVESGSAPPPDGRVDLSIRAGLDFYQTIQMEDGHFPGDYGGPMFLMPGLIITCYTTGVMDSVLPAPHRREMIRYLVNHQNDDGGFGLHIEGHSTMFGTVLSYVSLRILGLGPDEEAVVRARAWIHARGGATYIPSWGKFWLSVLGVFDWMGQNPLTPEMWLLPYWVPLHPGRFWCHCRMVYLPMSYVYGVRGTCKPTKLTSDLRAELYTKPYAEIDWNAARSECAREDLYYPHPMLQDAIWWGFYQAEGVLDEGRPLHWLRKKALKEVMEHVHYEDEQTRYIDIGPVNKAINMLACWLEDPDGVEFKKHCARVPDYLWVAEDGMKMQGYNGSQLWDTAFAVQAIGASGHAAEFAECMRKAHGYLEKTQTREDAPSRSKYYRHISRGAWPFSTRDHGWPISDCTSEGLKAAITLAGMPASLVGEPISRERLCEAINVILSYQNAGSGGWATYENTRGYPWMEILNPAETFGDIIIDYPYVECSSACLTAMRVFADKYPDHRKDEIARSMARGKVFLESIQRADGSWYGSWGVCFTYACWFGIDGLYACGETYESSPAIRKAVEFVLSKQRSDGGWGESYLSCQDKVYTHLEGGGSHVVNTAWAMLGLLKAGQQRRDSAPLHAAARSLMRAQLAGGDWPQQQISGVFNRNCMITYANYRNIFPIWALGEYQSLVHGGHG